MPDYLIPQDVVHARNKGRPRLLNWQYKWGYNNVWEEHWTWKLTVDNGKHLFIPIAAKWLVSQEMMILVYPRLSLAHIMERQSVLSVVNPWGNLPVFTNIFQFTNIFANIGNNSRCATVSMWNFCFIILAYYSPGLLFPKCNIQPRSSGPVQVCFFYQAYWIPKICLYVCRHDCILCM